MIHISGRSNNDAIKSNKHRFTINILTAFIRNVGVFTTTQITRILLGVASMVTIVNMIVADKNVVGDINCNECCCC